MQPLLKQVLPSETLEGRTIDDWTMGRLMSYPGCSRRDLMRFAIDLHNQEVMGQCWGTQENG